MDDDAPAVDAQDESAVNDIPDTAIDPELLELSQEEQIVWLLKKVQLLTGQLSDLKTRVTEAAANLPTPESVALLVEQATQPTREALENLARELRDSALPTPAQQEPIQPSNTPEESIKTEHPQKSAEESQGQESQPEAPKESKQGQIIKV